MIAVIEVIRNSATANFMIARRSFDRSRFSVDGSLSKDCGSQMSVSLSIDGDPYLSAAFQVLSSYYSFLRTCLFPSGYSVAARTERLVEDPCTCVHYQDGEGYAAGI